MKELFIKETFIIISNKFKQKLMEHFRDSK